MSASMFPRAFATLLTLTLSAGVLRSAGAQTLVESSLEARFQLDLQVPQSALMRFVPDGWTTNVSTDPTVYQISRQQQVLDILSNVTTTPPDRVRAFSLTAEGGRYSGLFDGTEKVLSWDNIVWLNRDVLSGS